MSKFLPFIIAGIQKHGVGFLHLVVAAFHSPTVVTDVNALLTNTDEATVIKVLTDLGTLAGISAPVVTPAA